MLSKFVGISKSGSPLGLYRLAGGGGKVVAIPTIPLEYVEKNFYQLFSEKTVCRKTKSESKIVFEQIDSIGEGWDVIEHDLFLFVVDVPDFDAFLATYADIPDRCPECHNEAIARLSDRDRLTHIIGCRWKSSSRLAEAAVARQLS